MPLRVDLILVRDGENDVVVVQVAGDLCADRLGLPRRGRCCRSGGCRRIATASATATSTPATATRGTNGERHLNDRHRMSRLRMNAGVRGADVEIDVFQILLPRGDEHLTTAL